jgi:hypothetical protein
MNPREQETLERSLERFFQKDPNLRSYFLILLADQSLKKAEIFRRISNHKGSPSTHCSGKREGAMKHT